MKVCLNCKFYGEGAYHQCRETNAEWVKEKDKANFCEYFEFKESESECPSQKERVEEMWKGLFKKSRG
ncbi:MAG: hypothetical protein HY878_04125 [Deltaproteobacteria bacterium]|nr:hypothetical protein [Deltaproteobacteria bacterium]